MQAQPYLIFDGRAEEAAAFYAQAIGAEVLTKMRFDESPEPMPPGMVAPGAEKKIMHMSLRIGDSTVMAADGGQCTGQPTFDGFSLTLNADDAAHANRLFNALADGGAVRMPLTKTFFSPCFGMLADRFGVSWMIIVDETP